MRDFWVGVAVSALVTTFFISFVAHKASNKNGVPGVALGVVERSPSPTPTPMPVATTLPFVSTLPDWAVSENPLSAIERRLDAIEKRLDALE